MHVALGVYSVSVCQLWMLSVIMCVTLGRLQLSAACSTNDTLNSMVIHAVYDLSSLQQVLAAQGTASL